jgi:hypothetical protein
LGSARSCCFLENFQQDLIVTRNCYKITLKNIFSINARKVIWNIYHSFQHCFKWSQNRIWNKKGREKRFFCLSIKFSLSTHACPEFVFWVACVSCSALPTEGGRL